jgi:hypothetical protein
MVRNRGGNNNRSSKDSSNLSTHPCSRRPRRHRPPHRY